MQPPWKTCDPERVARAYTDDSQWRNRHEFFQGRGAIVEFLRRKWAGNEHWEFDEDGYMRRRDASINDYKIEHSERRIHVDRD